MRSAAEQAVERLVQPALEEEGARHRLVAHLHIVVDGQFRQSVGRSLALGREGRQGGSPVVGVVGLQREGEDVGAGLRQQRVNLREDRGGLLRHAHRRLGAVDLRPRLTDLTARVDHVAVLDPAAHARVDAAALDRRHALLCALIRQPGPGSGGLLSCHRRVLRLLARRALQLVLLEQRLVEPFNARRRGAEQKLLDHRVQTRVQGLEPAV